MKLRNPVVALLVAALITASCTCEEAHFSLHTDVANGFAISYPGDWSRVPEDEVPQGILVMFRPESPCGSVSTSINVVRGELYQPMTVDELFAEKQTPLSMLGEYTPISTEKVTVNGVDAIKHVFSAWGEPLTVVQAMQLYLVDGMVAWVVTCRCDPACYDGYEAMFDTVVNSFTVLE